MSTLIPDWLNPNVTYANAVVGNPPLNAFRGMEIDYRTATLVGHRNRWPNRVYYGECGGSETRCAEHCSQTEYDCRCGVNGLYTVDETISQFQHSMGALVETAFMGKIAIDEAGLRSSVAVIRTIMFKHGAFQQSYLCDRCEDGKHVSCYGCRCSCRQNRLALGMGLRYGPSVRIRVVNEWPYGMDYTPYHLLRGVGVKRAWGNAFRMLTNLLRSMFESLIDVWSSVRDSLLWIAIRGNRYEAIDAIERAIDMMGVDDDE